jgi:hypothetical protein
MKKLLFCASLVALFSADAGAITVINNSGLEYDILVSVNSTNTRTGKIVFKGRIPAAGLDIVKPITAYIKNHKESLNNVVIEAKLNKQPVWPCLYSIVSKNNTLENINKAALTLSLDPVGPKCCVAGTQCW